MADPNLYCPGRPGHEEASISVRQPYNYCGVGILSFVSTAVGKSVGILDGNLNMLILN